MSEQKELQKDLEELNPSVSTKTTTAVDTPEEEQVTETQVRRYKQLRNTPDASRRSGRPLNAQNLAKRINVFNQMAEDPEYSGCIVKWKRLHPRINPLTQESLVTIHRDMSMPMSKWIDVTASIKEMNGGGRYRVDVINEGGQSEHILEATIDTDEFPPRNPPHAAIINPQGQATPRSDSIQKQIENKIKRDEEAADLEHAIKLQKLEEAKADAEYKREEREKKRHEESEGGGMKGAMAQFMLESIKGIQESIKSSNEMMLRAIEKMNEPKEDKTTPLMIQMFNMQLESMKAQNEKDIARIEAESKKPKDDSSERWMNTFMQLNQETNKLMMQIAMSGKNDKMSDTLLQILMNNLKDASSSKNNSLKDAMGVISMAKGLFMDGEIPDMDETPQSPWAGALSALGNGIGSALTQRLMGGGVPGVPAQPPVLPNNQNLLPASNPGGTTEVNFDEEDEAPQQQQRVITPPPPQQAWAPDPSTVEGRDAINLTNLMRMALKDMAEERREHRWIIPAVKNISPQLLDKISKIDSDAEGDELIMSEIEPYIEPRVYNTLVAIMNDQRKFETCYVNFFSAWNQIKELYKDEQKQKQKAENNAAAIQAT